jgi:hypothetical protein
MSLTEHAAVHQCSRARCATAVHAAITLVAVLELCCTVCVSSAGVACDLHVCEQREAVLSFLL